MKNKFTQEDKDKVIMFLNLVASNSELKLNVNEIIKFYGLLSYMQKDLLGKIDQNILEVVEVKENEDKGE